MANWCEGLIKLKGKQADIFNFLVNEIRVYKTVVDKPYSYFKYVLDDSAISIDKIYSTIIISKTAHIEGTERNFLEPNNIYIDADTNGNACIALEFRAAWRVESNPYIDFSKKYHIDIKIDTFEKGMEFSQHILIENGQLISDEEKQYNNYVWDCVMPNLGG